MEIRLQFEFLTISILILFFFSTTSIVAIEEVLRTTSAASTISSPFPQSPLPSQDIQDSLSPTVFLEQILTNLGFQELTMVVPSLSDSAFTTWNGPSTLFAPTDASIRSCHSCSVPLLLREHIVPGIFSSNYLRKLAFGTKIETMSPGRCITVTSAHNTTKIFIGGVEITRPELFNNGLIVIHGIEGFVSPLSPFSCSVERMTSLSFPPQPSVTAQTFSSSPIMRLMLRDAMLRLRNNGFNVLSLALRVKYAELVNLQTMTVFALDDALIFSGGHDYVSNVKFHIVPNRFLMKADLERLPTGTALPSLEHGQMLLVTTPGEGGAVPIRINYVQIKVPDVVHNLKIVVHSVFFPFPRLHPATGDGNVQAREGDETVTLMGSCEASDEGEGCTVFPTVEYHRKMKKNMEDHHGL